jgi:hypothetical protein
MCASTLMRNTKPPLKNDYKKNAHEIEKTKKKE